MGSMKNDEFELRRLALAEMYCALPTYNTLAFWEAVEHSNISLEVLVRVMRSAIINGDRQGRDRLISVIINRTRKYNERWARSIVSHFNSPNDDHAMLIADLYADLLEAMFRSLITGRRDFWEENFLSRLIFEQKHVKNSFMRREGRDCRHRKHGARIPRSLIVKFDHFIQCLDNQLTVFDIEDEQAHKMLLAVEHCDLHQLIYLLPPQLKLAIVSIFWEGRSMKDTARLLCVSERTIRNRLQQAYERLSVQLAIPLDERKAALVK